MKAAFLIGRLLFGAALALMGVEEPWPASLPAAQPRKLGKVIKFARWKLAALSAAAGETGLALFLRRVKGVGKGFSPATAKAPSSHRWHRSSQA
jgi:hypothetical protein